MKETTSRPRFTFNTVGLFTRDMTLSSIWSLGNSNIPRGSMVQ